MVDLGDKRLNKRFSQLITQFMRKPTASIPQASGNWKNTKAAYRFFSNESVSPEKILRAHYALTQHHINETAGTILVAQDTTDCDYSTHFRTKGLGYLQGEKLFGIKMHSALAISENGTPLGLLSQKRWIRDIGEFGKRRMKGKEKRTMEEKESNRWLTTVREVERYIPKSRQAVVIGDRESDLYALFAMPRTQNIHILVRAKNNRYLWGTNKRLFAKVLDRPLAGTYRIFVRRIVHRLMQKVEIGVQYASVTLASKNGRGAIRLWVVAAEEKAPPYGVKPIRWILLTTVPVTTYPKAKEIIDWYAKRWLIERFHYTLKSGCKIEELQLQEKERLERALSIYSIVAWELLWITHEAREHPDKSYRRIITQEEWDVLCAASSSGKKTPETIYEAVRMIAKLGGFLARKNDGEPGVKTLWIGMLKLSYMMTGWNLLKKKRN